MSERIIINNGIAANKSPTQFHDKKQGAYVISGGRHIANLPAYSVKPNKNLDCPEQNRPSTWKEMRQWVEFVQDQKNVKNQRYNNENLQGRAFLVYTIDYQTSLTPESNGEELIKNKKFYSLAISRGIDKVMQCFAQGLLKMLNPTSKYLGQATTALVGWVILPAIRAALVSVGMVLDLAKDIVAAILCAIGAVTSVVVSALGMGIGFLYVILGEGVIYRLLPFLMAALAGISIKILIGMQWVIKNAVSPVVKALLSIVNKNIYQSDRAHNREIQGHVKKNTSIEAMVKIHKFTKEELVDAKYIPENVDENHVYLRSELLPEDDKFVLAYLSIKKFILKGASIAGKYSLFPPLKSS